MFHDGGGVLFHGTHDAGQKGARPTGAPDPHPKARRKRRLSSSADNQHEPTSGFTCHGTFGLCYGRRIAEPQKHRIAPFAGAAELGLRGVLTTVCDTKNKNQGRLVGWGRFVSRGRPLDWGKNG